MNADTAAARVENATKVYGSGDTTVTALDDVTISFERGKFTAIMGPSGSGKSTLLHCVAGLDDLTGGSVFIGSVRLGDLKEGRAGSSREHEPSTVRPAADQPVRMRNSRRLSSIAVMAVPRCA